MSEAGTAIPMIVDQYIVCVWDFERTILGIYVTIYTLGVTVAHTRGVETRSVW